MAIELGTDLLCSEHVSLSAEDLAFGFERGLVHRHVVVDMATRSVESGSTDTVLVELAGLLRQHLSRVEDVLEMLHDPKLVHDPRDSARKWLYLQLKAAFVIRQGFRDPLAVVEEIYSDFEYPPAIVRFVRYMPLAKGDEPGEDALLCRWKEYLNQESRSLAGM